MQLPSYPKIHQLGHRTIRDIFEDEVEITEKVNGSQFTFGKVQGLLAVRSRGADIVTYAPDSMFRAAVESVLTAEDRIPDGLVFYGEALTRPKHNVLKYDRMPASHVALFAVMDVHTREMFKYEVIQQWADTLGMEAVPRMHQGLSDVESILGMLDRESFLGGTKIEGVVVKNYHKDAMIGDVYIPYLVGKYVSEQFKERHSVKPYGKKEVKVTIDTFLDSFCTEARFHKAVQHLREQGKLVEDPKDIGPLIKELNIDFVEECKDEIMEFLWRQYSKEAHRRMSRGFPEWYKRQLMD